MPLVLGALAYRRRCQTGLALSHSDSSQSQDTGMNTIIWLVVGGLIGWAASVLLRTQEGVLLNVIVGVLGAALGGWLLSPIFGVSTVNQSTFSAASLLVSLVGAVLLLAIVSFVLRRRPRTLVSLVDTRRSRIHRHLVETQNELNIASTRGLSPACSSRPHECAVARRVRIDTSGTHCRFASRAAGYRRCRGRGGRTLRSSGVGRSAYRARVR